MTETDELARAFKALANPNRLKIYREFLEYWQQGLQKYPEGVPQGCLLAEGIQRLNISAPTVSHHIKELANAGLITTTREGRQLYCSINPEMRDRLVAFLAAAKTPLEDTGTE
jgi:DNA-binding transcriptional ArsR family regulator